MLSVGILLEFLIDLHGQVVEFNLIKLFLNFELDLEFLSKRPSFASVEREGSNMVWLSTVCGELSVFPDLQWDLEAVGLEWTDIEIDWDLNVLEQFCCFASKYASEGASWLVWLLRVVNELNLGKEGLSRLSNQDFAGDRNDFCSFESPSVIMLSTFVMFVAMFMSIFISSFLAAVSSRAFALEWAASM